MLLVPKYFAVLTAWREAVQNEGVFDWQADANQIHCSQPFLVESLKGYSARRWC